MLGADGDFITSPEVSQIFGEVRCLELSNRKGRFKPLSVPIFPPAARRLDHQRVAGSESTQTASAGRARARKRVFGQRHPQSKNPGLF